MHTEPADQTLSLFYRRSAGSNLLRTPLLECAYLVYNSRYEFLSCLSCGYAVEGFGHPCKFHLEKVKAMLDLTEYAQVNSLVCGADGSRLAVRLTDCLRDEIRTMRADTLGAGTSGLSELPSLASVALRVRTESLPGVLPEPLEGLVVTKGWRCSDCEASNQPCLFPAASTKRTHLRSMHKDNAADIDYQEAYIQILTKQPTKQQYVEVSFVRRHFKVFLSVFTFTLTHSHPPIHFICLHTFQVSKPRLLSPGSTLPDPPILIQDLVSDAYKGDISNPIDLKDLNPIYLKLEWGPTTEMDLTILHYFSTPPGGCPQDVLMKEGVDPWTDMKQTAWRALEFLIHDLAGADLIHASIIAREEAGYKVQKSISSNKYAWTPPKDDTLFKTYSKCVGRLLLFLYRWRMRNQLGSPLAKEIYGTLGEKVTAPLDAFIRQVETLSSDSTFEYYGGDPKDLPIYELRVRKLLATSTVADFRPYLHAVYEALFFRRFDRSASDTTK